MGLLKRAENSYTSDHQSIKHTHIRNSQPYQLHVSTHAVTDQAYRDATQSHLITELSHNLNDQVMIDTSATTEGKKQQRGLKFTEKREYLLVFLHPIFEMFT